MGVDCNITERLLFQNMGQLKHNRTFVISENEVSFELSSQICTQDNKKYVIQRILVMGDRLNFIIDHRLESVDAFDAILPIIIGSLLHHTNGYKSKYIL